MKLSYILKDSKRFYFIILILLTVIVFRPIWECIMLLMNVISGTIVFEFANENLMIPFTSISIALLVGFSLFPLLLKCFKVSFKKTKLILFVISIAVFIGSSLFIEKIALKQWHIGIKDGESISNYLHYGNLISDEESLFLAHGEYWKHLISRSVLNSRAPFVYKYAISPVIKIHYYFFSIILILIMLNLLYNLTSFFTKNEQEISKNLLITQGLAAVCYLLSFLFVKVIHYEDFESKYITAESAISALLCIVLAAASAGFFADKLLNKKSKMRFIPSIVSSSIVIILYIAEYFMLGGGFYRYGEGFLFDGLPFIRTSIFNIIIIILPALIVYFIINTANLKRKG